MTSISRLSFSEKHHDDEMETAEPERESMVEKHESEDGEEEEEVEEEEEEAGDESSEEEGAHSDSESRSEQSRSEGEHQVLSPAHGLSPHPHCASKGSSHKFAFIKKHVLPGKKHIQKLS